MVNTKKIIHKTKNKQISKQTTKNLLKQTTKNLLKQSINNNLNKHNKNIISNKINKHKTSKVNQNGGLSVSVKGLFKKRTATFICENESQIKKINNNIFSNLKNINIKNDNDIKTEIDANNLSIINLFENNNNLSTLLTNYQTKLRNYYFQEFKTNDNVKLFLYHLLYVYKNDDDIKCKSGILFSNSKLKKRIKKLRKMYLKDFFAGLTNTGFFGTFAGINIAGQAFA